MFSWMEVLSQWKQGIIYPRWGALAHWSYGEARFLFYPPASWTLGAALGAFLPWWVVPGTFIWIALWLAGISMFSVAKHWLAPRDALFAAILYAVNPYHVLIVYWRSAFAELLTAALLPLLVLWAVRLEERGLRPMLWLSGTLAAVWLTNAPAAVMVHYSLALFAVVIAVLTRSWRPLTKSAIAILLGAALASFYLLPAAYEEKWVNIGEVLSPGVRPIDNFLFTTISDPDHNRFNFFVSLIAAAEIATVAAAMWFSRGWRKKQGNLWILLSAWAAVSVIVMFSITNIFWEHLPKLRFVQLPWRWLLCLNAALALVSAMAIRRWSVRIAATFALLAVVALAGWRIQPPWWDYAADIREMAMAMSDGTGNEGTDEYVPTGADPYEINKEEPLVILCRVGIVARDCPPATAQILDWSAVSKHVKVNTSEAGNLVLRLFNYPAWEVKINGQPVQAETSDVTGQMVIPVKAGTSSVEIRFRRTPDRAIGDALSMASIAVFLALWWETRTLHVGSEISPVGAVVKKKSR